MRVSDFGDAVSSFSPAEKLSRGSTSMVQMPAVESVWVYKVDLTRWCPSFTNV
jgi:hypothetical protein